MVAVACGTLPAQVQESASQDPPASAESPSSSGVQGGAEATQPLPEPPGGKRVFGVLPNYRTAASSEIYTPITTKQKFTIASKDSFDYPLVLLAAGLAGLGQLTDQNPSFHQGLEGYAHRLWTGYVDQALGNMMTEGLFPAMLHEDPRYFRKGTGPKWSRAGYAVSRIFVTRTDSGGTRFNYSEWVGNATAVAISNIYYPDNRTALDNATKLVEQCGIDAASQVLKEFWPDIKHKFFHGKQE
jgi:hypothetical protein